MLTNARHSFAAGDYRWVAQVVNHLVFADPDNQDARALQADALEQLGYQAESGTWRNCYLSGAKELRDGVIKEPMTFGEVVKSIPLDMVFDLLAIQLNGPRAEGKTITINAIFTDTNDRYVLLVEHGVLNYAKGKHADAADATLTTSRAVLDQILQGEATWKDKFASKEAIVEGRQEKLLEFLSLLDAFNFWFNVVTP